MQLSSTVVEHLLLFCAAHLLKRTPDHRVCVHSDLFVRSWAQNIYKDI